MAGLNPKQTNKNLLQKGFIKGEKDHHIFEFWHEGKFILYTKTSHGTKEIYDGLISAMSNQCRVSSNFFKQFARCTKSKEEYVEELKNNKVL